MLLSKVILIGLETVLSNHIYQCQNKLYRQLKGGGIGTRITGVIARVIMDVWMDLATTALEENKVIIYLMTKYVDDINIATSLIPKGFSWTKEDRKWKLKWSEEQEKLDEGKSPELVTMEKIRWIGDQLVPGLKLTQDLPENHPSGKCPMLDFQVWAQETGSHVTIRHTFYQKATTLPLVFNAGGAMGGSQKSPPCLKN